jgi:predicted transcriptional regulator
MATKVVPGLNSDDCDSILEEFAPVHEEPNDITVEKAKEKWHVKGNFASRELNKLVEQGILTKTWGILKSGKRGWLYRKK